MEHRRPKIEYIKTITDQNNRIKYSMVDTVNFHGRASTFAEGTSYVEGAPVCVCGMESKQCKCADIETIHKDAQDRIKQIQEQYLQRADEVNQMLTERHREEMIKKVEQQLQVEREWAEEKEKLVAEISKLKKDNEITRKHLSDAKQHAGQVQILELKVSALEQEIERLQGEKSKMDAISRGQLDQLRKIEFYEEQNKNLKNELEAGNQKIKELEFKVRKLEREFSEQGKEQQDEIMTVLKNKLAKMHEEKVLFEDKEKQLEKSVVDLQDENSRLRRALDDSERMRLEMRDKIEQLMYDLSLLQKQATTDKDRQTFRDFIQVKRELAAVKEENETLRIKLKFGAVRENALPSLKDSDPRNGAQPRVGLAKGSKKKHVSSQVVVVGHR